MFQGERIQDTIKFGIKRENRTRDKRQAPQETGETGRIGSGANEATMFQGEKVVGSSGARGSHD